MGTLPDYLRNTFIEIKLLTVMYFFIIHTISYFVNIFCK